MRILVSITDFFIIIIIQENTITAIFFSHFSYFLRNCLLYFFFQFIYCFCVLLFFISIVHFMLAPTFNFFLFLLQFFFLLANNSFCFFDTSWPLNLKCFTVAFPFWKRRTTRGTFSKPSAVSVRFKSCAKQLKWTTPSILIAARILLETIPYSSKYK